MVAVVASFVLALPFQFALGCGYCALRARSSARRRPVPRRRLTTYARASRTLRLAALWTAPPAAVILAIGLFTESVRPNIDAFEAIRLVIASATVSGGWIALEAGRSEAHGRPRQALAGVRIGGRTMFGGAVVELALAGAWIIAGPYSAGPPAALGLIGLGGFVALLAALSGKPRPSVPFAVLFYVAGRLASG